MTLDPLADRLASGVRALGLALTPDQQAKLLDYLGLIQKWNQVYNLTAVRDPQEMLSHHLLDSLAVIAPLQRYAADRPLRLLDVGSGAGLPGVVIAICCPDMRIDCVDTVGKKAAFIQQAALTLKLPTLRGLHDRVERLTGPYDVITSRAFASLADFVVWSGGALGEGGVWLAMKGKHPADEVIALPPQMTVFHVEPLQVPGLDAERCLLWLKKVGPVT
ncbi:MAG: putative glucose inhibited division protein [Pseudomonadota bacterium]|jgi:16S rRNA (guanine527-N7)-methyltransferase